MNDLNFIWFHFIGVNINFVNVNMIIFSTTETKSVISNKFYWIQQLNTLVEVKNHAFGSGVSLL